MIVVNGVVYLGGLQMNSIGFLHSHYIPNEVKKDFDDIYAIIVPEFYPDLIYHYYGELEYFNNLNDGITWINKRTQKKEHYLYSIENVHILKNIEDLEKLKNQNVFSVQIFHSKDNEYYNHNYGLTKRGKELLAKIYELDMYLDLSHLNDYQVFDILKIYKGKVLVSHCSCSDSRQDNNLRSNELNINTIERIIKRNGQIGVCFVNNIIANKIHETKEHRVFEDICKQIIYLYKRFGSDNIALGPDFFYMNYYSKVYKEELFIPCELYRKKGYEKMGNVLLQELKNVDVKKIMYENVKKLFDIR